MNVKQFVDYVDNTLQRIFKEKNKNAFNDFKEGLNGVKWPIGLGKQHMHNVLQRILDGTVEPEKMMIDFAFGQMRKMPKLQEWQRKVIIDIQKHIEAMQLVVCEHKRIGIAAFLHGGGLFTPTYALPEYICLDCGLNVTLSSYGLKSNLKGVIKISKKEMQAMEKWANECLRKPEEGKYLHSSGDIPYDPPKAYADSYYKWNGPIPEILKKEEFEKLSGV